MGAKNKAFKERMDTSGERWNPGRHSAECLVAGWFQNGPQIIEIAGNGDIGFYWEEGFYGIGVGGNIALAAIAAQPNRGQPLNNFRRLMQNICLRITQCGPPFSIFRITPSGVELIESWGVTWRKQR